MVEPEIGVELEIQGQNAIQGHFLMST
jgi:hypothetical protein